MTLSVHPADRRYRTVADGHETFHSFSFGPHYDPANLGFAALVAHNDENLPGGTGYDEHPHAELEIVTWVLSGALRHTDDSGSSVVLGPGDLLRTSAGTGIRHTEHAETGTDTRFLQAWLRPDHPGATPSYAGGRHAPDAGLTEVVGGDGLGLGVGGARLWLGRADGELVLPEAARTHLFVVAGDARLGDRALGAGDAARLIDEGGRRLQLKGPATLAIWAFTD